MSRRLAAVALVMVSCSRSERTSGASGSGTESVTVRGVHFKFDGNPAEWRAAQSTFTQTVGVRTGSIWVDQNDSGLVVAGMAFGDRPNWPGNVSDLPRSDRVVMTLADARPPEFPPIGWGHQFGFQELATSADCGKKAAEDNSGPRDRGRCVAWFDRQVAYRDTVRQLFQREWEMVPNMVREVSGARALDSLGGKARDFLKPLQPGVLPQVKFGTSDSGWAYGFEALIPWEAFPPMRSLDLGEVRLAVRFTGSSGPQDPGPLARYGLPQPREYLLTPCRYGIEDSVVIFSGANRDWLEPSEHARSYYIPTVALDIRRTLILDNQSQGYLYEPGPDTRSPIVHEARYWTRDLGDGDILCGPRLAVQRQGRLAKSGWVVDEGERIEVKSLPNGDRLLKDGPRVWMSYYGSGQCGACPRAGITIFYEDSNSGTISRALDQVGIVEVESTDVDYAVSADWQTVDVYQGAMDTSRDSLGALSWNQTSYCLRPGSREYAECGKKASVTPPNPRNINPDSLFH